MGNLPPILPIHYTTILFYCQGDFIMLTLKEIIQAEKNNEQYIAIDSNGTKYNAAYNAKLKTMFFCIPSNVKIIGYIKF